MRRGESTRFIAYGREFVRGRRRGVVVLSIGKLGHGQESYYLETVVSGAEDYSLGVVRRRQATRSNGAGDIGPQGYGCGVDECRVRDPAGPRP